MDSVALLQRVVDQTTQVVDGITPDQLTASTPCTEWTVRDVLNHIVGGSTMFAVSAEQGSVPDEMVGQLMGGDNIGDDYKAAWKTSSVWAMAAFAEPGALEKTVTLPFGQMPAGVVLNIAIFDVATHAVDLAKSSGQTVTDDELLEQALAIGQQMIGDALRAPGVFDAAQPIADDAPIADRLSAFAGRTV